MKKLIIFSALLVYLAGFYYLTRPDPALPILADSARSDEPGDTVQHPDQAAYYTHRDNRGQILSELQKRFDLKDSWTSLISYRLNYRPEEVGELVRDQLRSYYLEEVVHPLRESLFINVFDPAKSPMIDDEKREQARMYLHGQFYPIKVTLRPVYSEVWGRLLIWTLIFPGAYAVYLSLKQSLKSQI
jgi:hypothetical protein